MATKHTCNAGRGPVFGKRTSGCPRCDELAAGAPPVAWRGSASRAFRSGQAARELKAIREHDCARNGCGPICTAFDW